MSENLDAMTKEFIGSRAARVFDQYQHITGDGGDYRVRLQEAKADLNLLLDRARAEGAERMKETILVSAIYMKQIDSIMENCYIIPASVFAPKGNEEIDEEGKNYAERLRDSVTDEINGEDIDPTPD